METINTLDYRLSMVFRMKTFAINTENMHRSHNTALHHRQHWTGGAIAVHQFCWQKNLNFCLLREFIIFDVSLCVCFSNKSIKRLHGVHQIRFDFRKQTINFSLQIIWISVCVWPRLECNRERMPFVKRWTLEFGRNPNSDTENCLKIVFYWLRRRISFEPQILDSNF